MSRHVAEVDYTLGRVAEWSCSGLQSRVRRFDSDLGLQIEVQHSPKKS